MHAKLAMAPFKFACTNSTAGHSSAVRLAGQAHDSGRTRKNPSNAPKHTRNEIPGLPSSNANMPMQEHICSCKVAMGRVNFAKRHCLRGLERITCRVYV